MQSAYSISPETEREELILAHMPQVRWIAGSIRERLPAFVNEEDLISAGVIGLIQAIDNYDAAKNASLRTYAEFRIRGAILDSIRGLDGIDPHKRKRTKLVAAAISTLQARHGRAPEEEEIAAELAITPEQYRTWLTELRGVTLGSLSTLSSSEDQGLLSYIADPRAEDPVSTLERQEMQQLLQEGISAMPPTERLILDLYFHQELTLAEIGKVLGVHLSRVSQLKVQAILRLRSYLQFRLTTRKSA